MLINVSDHFTRFKANGQRSAGPPLVMGCLLGSQDGRAVDVANSFEIKYTETEEGWQVDHPFLLKKQEQCKCNKRLDHSSSNSSQATSVSVKAMQ